MIGADYLSATATEPVSILVPVHNEASILNESLMRMLGAIAGLRVAFGFRGTDTHGLKALRKARLEPIAAQCVTDRSLFDTELVLRAERAALRVVEIPVDVREIRQPGWWSIAGRAPEAVWNLIRL